MTIELKRRDNQLGRSPLLERRPEIVNQIAEIVAAGNYVEVACRSVGIDDGSFYGWLRKAQDDIKEGLEAEESIYIRFFNAIKAAEAQAELKTLAVVQEAAQVKREWLPAMTFLERRHPERWGRKDRLQVDQHTTKEVIISRMTVVKDLPAKDETKIIDSH
jgi:transposase-like protein